MLSALLGDGGGATVLTELQKKGLVYVPQADKYNVEGVCMTGPQQIHNGSGSLPSSRTTSSSTSTPSGSCTTACGC